MECQRLSSFYRRRGTWLSVEEGHMSYGNRIIKPALKAALKRKRWTLRTLAIVAGISEDFMEDLSCGRSGARAYAQNKINKALGMKPKDLWHLPWWAEN
jgi:lambda repressor-like predicted transcriptional regulator